MSKANDVKYLFIFIFAVLTIVGIVILLNSPSWGMSLANHYLARNGGGLDPAQFVALMQSYEATYRVFGVVLFSLGGFFFLREVSVVAKGTK